MFISTSALVMGKNVSFQAKAEEWPKETYFTPIPKLIGNSAAFPVLSAQAALVIDLPSGVNLYEKNHLSHLLPASTTKILTALVALDAYPLELNLKVGRVKVEGQKMGLAAGQELRAEDLLFGLLVYSANDAAEVLADNYPGGRKAFIDAMNLKASQLSMVDSNFINPSGLDGNTTTARDLAILSQVAMKNPEFAKIVGTKEITVWDRSGKRAFKLKNINELLGEVPGVLGVKTGWTENARENLVTYIEREDKKIMMVVLGSQDRFGETKELIDWVFANYNWEEVKFVYSP